MWLKCPECRDESAFEQPPCADGHGFDCPEWFCVSCGFAVFVGGLDESILTASTRVAPADASGAAETTGSAREKSSSRSRRSHAA